MNKKAKKPTKTEIITFLWEYSKKIVRALSIAYIIGMVLSFVTMWALKDATALPTVVEWLSKVFSTVVGCYFVKAAVENVFKIYFNSKPQSVKEGEEDDCQ